MILKYDVICAVRDWSKPYVDKHNRNLLIPKPKELYSYYLEVKEYDNMYDENKFYLLLGMTKFHDSAKRCWIDAYGRLKLLIHNEFAEYVREELKTRPNLEIEEVPREADDDYDTFRIY